MNPQERFNEINAIYQQGLRNVAENAPPPDQKFPIGARVRFKDDPKSRATVLHTYLHAYGDNCTNAVKRYCLDVDGFGVSAWHWEEGMELVE